MQKPQFFVVVVLALWGCGRQPTLRTSGVNSEESPRSTSTSTLQVLDSNDSSSQGALQPIEVDVSVLSH